MTFDQAIEHYTELAMRPGWWAYARLQVQAMEQDEDAQGAWEGLRAAVGAQIKAAGFRPHPSELGEWWK